MFQQNQMRDISLIKLRKDFRHRMLTNFLQINSAKKKKNFPTFLDFIFFLLWDSTTSQLCFITFRWKTQNLLSCSKKTVWNDFCLFMVHYNSMLELASRKIVAMKGYACITALPPPPVWTDARQHRLVLWLL